MQAEEILRTANRTMIACFLSFLLAAQAVAAQESGTAKHKPVPAKIDKRPLVIPDSVVTVQWAHSLQLVNAPDNLALVNPGQCIRVAIFATGDDRDSLLEKTRLSLHISLAGRTQDYASAAFAETKQLKPEGGDFVTAVAAAADIKIPSLSMASMGASAGNWCVPADAQDGLATIEGEVDTPAGQQKLDRVRVQIESFETGSKRAFKDTNEMEEFTTTYYRHPEPARLLPALQSYAADEKARAVRGTLESTVASIGFALKGNPVAAKDFMTRVAAQKGFTRAVGLMILLFGGYDIDPVLKTWSEEDRQMFARHPALPDPFDFKPEGENPTRLDMLWGEFMSTGQFLPVQKIASALAWHSDWVEFEKLRKSPNHPTEWTPTIDRAVTYGAAGWALGSFQRTDHLAADYIEYIRASPDTPADVKSELKDLATNPAFHMGNAK